ncbi:DEAD/DEAH box helicase [Hymenobacter mucosus]|uniref:Helicase conserved C-terminal domain-containing protein n=1 Tax=Hymenobacter mucosus TaxID=1411120 RepID=A0A238WVR1_9BACT|nr:DEAD/DEAH box helicase [Hymenobacter mucosus]SNR50274.1 Helicase conserved C-terminal domain-containing protein [Hymenobacter mucosus]
MKVSTSQPFQIVYSLLEHEYLGYLFESYVVQRNQRGQLTLQHQTVSAKNAAEFADGLDETDFELVALTDQIQQDVVMKEFWPKKITPADFFLKIYDADKGDKGLQEAICTYVQERMGQILDRLQGKCVFIMGKDGEPTWREMQVAPEPASVLFHFRRNEDSTHYFPTIQYQGQKLDFQYKNAVIVCERPAWLLLGDTLHNFHNDVDGKKIKPFLNKKFIVIPRQVEDSYFQRFVAPLVESFDVHARGFYIRSERYVARPQLTFSDAPGVVTTPRPATAAQGRRGSTAVATATVEAPVSDHIHFDLSFRYGDHTVHTAHDKRVCVKLEKKEDNYIFHRLIRNLDREQEIIGELRDRALEVRNGRAVLEKATAFRWLHSHADDLTRLGFTVQQGPTSGKDYFIGAVTVQVGITETNDWFDVHGTVYFGEFEVPFIKLRPYILNKRHEYRLPNGQIAIIPEEWFTQYLELFAFSEEHNHALTLRKHHLALVSDLQNGNLATVLMSRKLEKLREFEAVEDRPLPAAFRGELRPYQKAGYNWLHFVQDYHFGGCLADDMGLGKTVQTLAMLLHRKESGAAKGSASLLVMPTSLVYNWMTEAFKFTPTLRLLIYTGTYRDKNVEQFADYDVVLTSYGIVRLDAELLKTYKFDYVILDESQAIKNPGSTTSQAVRGLQSRHRLILTGTPVENSTMDLWSQMSFINPGLLGTQAFFRKEFLKPIEKGKDEVKTRRLHTLIKPFILRRHKAQVARELPDKIEQLSYCPMTEEQQHCYEETKSFYRNKILQSIEEHGTASTQFMLLQGLTKLRQIANHPRMADEEYAHESGKLREVVRMIKNVVSEGHKVLVFSQFVKHLDIVRASLDERQIEYAYLDGNTRERHREVARFQETEDLRVFLISLKAGGVGLNLTAADYVFILDPWWNPAVEAQAIDRAHRIGQQRTVFTYKFITQNTVEEKILALQNKKIQLVTDLITTDEAIIKSLTKEDIEELLG